MQWLKSKTLMIAAVGFAVVGIQSYAMMSMRSTVDERLSSLDRQFQSMYDDDNSKLTQFGSDLGVVVERMGINAKELKEAHALAERLKKENAQTAQRLRRELDTKADSKSIVQFREEAAGRLKEVQQDTAMRMAGVSDDIQSVRTDLAATREDLANSKRDLGTLIAHNSTELADLRRKGERYYVEFDFRKTKQFEHVGDVLVQLRKTDVKRQKFDVVINSDDRSILKKDRTANEPVTFLVGRDRLRYEFVVNFVDRDRIRGYLSTPKDKLLASEVVKPRLQ